MKIKNGFRKVVSVVLAGAMAVGLAVTGGSSFGPKTVEAAAVSDYTTVNNVNFSGILGRGVNYGIISKQLEQICHMETTYATNYLINKVPPMNTDVDLAGYDTAYFIIAEIAPDSMARFGYTYGKKVAPQIGQLQKMNYYIETTPEAKASQFTFDGDNFYGDPLYRVYDKQTLTDNVNKMINDALDASTALSYGSSVDLNVVGSTTIPNEAPYSGRSYILDLSASEYDNATVYVDVEQGSALEKAIQESGQLIVKKKSNTTVVFNVKKTGNFTLGKYAVEVTDYNPATYDGQFDRTIVGNSATVEDYSGGKLVISSDTDHSGNDTLHNQLVDMELCQKIIWNVEKADNVEFKETAGTFILAKAGNNSDVKGSSAGWIVSNGNVKVSSGEWHYVYHGRSSDINTEDTAQFHFAAKKAFTNTNPTSVSYDDSKKDVKEYKDGNNHVTASVESFENQINALDNVYAEKGAYKFSFTETSDSQFSTPIGTTTEVSTDKYGKLTFPSISYQVNEIDPLNPVTRYFIIREKAFDNSLVNDENVSLLGTTGAVVTMAVTARSVEGIIYYTVDAKKYLTEADYTAGKCINHEWVETISGIEFSLGNLFNGYDLKTANLSITKDASVTDNADSADFASKYGNQEYEVALKKGNQYVHVQNDGSAVLGGEPYYIKVKSGETVNIKGLIPGDYVITEKTTDLIGYNLTTQSIKVGNTNDGSFTLAGNDNKTAEITNKYTKTDIAGKYKLNVRKTVEGLTGKTFHIAVAACDESGSPRAYVKNINGDFTTGNQEADIVWFDINSGESISFAGLPKTYVDGDTKNYTYKVLEKYSDDKVKGYDWTPEGFNGNSEYDNFRSSGIISFNNDDEAKFEVTNKFEPKKGSLKISKAFKDSSNTDISFESGVDLSGIKFTISGEGLTTSIEKVYNSTNFPNGVCTIDNLPYGSYTVTESGMNSVNSTYIYSSTQCGIDTLVDGTTGTVEVGDSGTKELKFVNYYDTPGSLTIKKSVSGLDSADNKTNFKVAVINSAGKYISYTDENTWTYSDSPVYITLSTAGSLKINNLPVGEYTIVEDKDDAAVAGYTLAVSGEKPNGKNTYTVSKGTNTDVAIENKYTKIEYGITITKKVLGTPPYSDTEYEIAIKNSGGAYLQSLDGKNFSSTPKYFDLSNGAKISAAVNEAGTYTIEERLAGKTVNTHYDLVTEIGGTAGTVDTTNKVVTGTVVLDDQNKKKDVEVTNTYSRIDQTASVTLVKTNIGGTAKLGGAVFSIAVKSGASGSVNNLTFTGTESGATASSFTTVDSKDVVISGLTDGTYVITEKTAPQDYDLLDHGIEFTVSNGVISGTAAEIGSSNTITVVNSLTVNSTTVTLSKKAVNGTDELSGAQLKITSDAAGNSVVKDAVSNEELSWTSTSTAKEVSLLDGIYYMIETTAPNGYAVSEYVQFEVSNGSVTKVGTTGEVSGTTVIMRDAPVTKVTLSKKEVNGTDELSGAQLKITSDAAGNNVVKDAVTGDSLSWTSTSTAKQVSLIDGTYYMIETQAPGGYEKAEKIQFTVANGSVAKVGTDGEVSGTTVTMRDAAVAVTGSLKVHKTLAAGSPQDAVGKTFTFTVTGPTEKPANERVTKTVTAVADSDSETITGLALGTYTVTEDTASAKVTNFDVAATTGSVTLTDANTATVEITNTYTTTVVDKKDVYISKTAVGGGSEIPGAKLSVTTVDQDGKTVTVESFESGNSPTLIQLPEGTYTLTETQAPNGYDIAESIIFKVTKDSATGALVVTDEAGNVITDSTVRMEDKLLPKGNLIVTKTISGPITENDKQNLTFTITNASGDLLGGKTYKLGDFTLQTDGSYTLTFNDIPTGDYKVVESLKDIDGTTCTVTYTIGDKTTTDSATASVTDSGTATVAIKDVYTKNVYEVKISKVDATNKKEIAGAQLELYAIDANGNQIAGGYDKKWTSTTSVQTFTDITAGDYAIRELVAPEGYEKVETLFKFRVSFDANGKATVTSLGTDLPGSYDSQTDLITFENDPIKVDTATGGMIVTVEEEGTKRRVPNATVEIEAPSGVKFPDGSTKLTLTTDDNGQITGYKDKDGKTIDLTTGLIPGDYKVTVTKVPDGYKVTTGKTDTVTVKPGEVTEHLALIGTGENTTDKSTDKSTETTTEKKPSDTPSTEVKQPDTTTTPNAPGTPNKDKTVVDTGDRVNVVPVMIVMIISIIGIIFIISRKRKMRYEY